MKTLRTVFYFFLIPIFTLPLHGAPADERPFSLDEVVSIISYEYQAAKKSAPPLPDVKIKKYIQTYFPKNKNGPFSQKEVEQLKGDALYALDPAPTEEKKFKLPPLLGIKIRQDYNDVVQEEDDSVQSPKEKRNQISGAAVSFSRDFKSDQSTWAVQGALIRPIGIFVRPSTEGDSASDPITLRAIYVTPSISLHRADAKDPKDDVDDLTFRLGGSARWNLVQESLISELEIRAFGAYATDTHFKSSIPAGQFDFEPRFYGRGKNARYALGLQGGLGPHDPSDKYPTDDSQFTYNLRIFGHGEFGSVDDTEGKTNLESGHFFRLGPEAKFEFQPCILARSLGMDPQALSFKLSYSYLARLNGVDPGHESYVSAGLDWALFKNDANSQKVSLKILYEKGGLEITKQEVDKLTIGLGITY